MSCTVSLICKICEDYLCKAHTATCGHSFCLLCLSEYLLFAELCPICAQPIRNMPIVPNPLLQQLACSLLPQNSPQLQRMALRREQTKVYIAGRELKTIKVGMTLDVQDDNHIWCEGLVLRIIAKPEEKCNYMRVSYLNSLQGREEDIKLTSSRLASHGFYTQRRDLPRYPPLPVNQVLTSYHK